MFADQLNAHYDSYHPKNALNLVHSLRSYISLKLDHEKKTPEFIAELRRRLYFVHEYNCQVAKVTHQYPRSRKLELLLIKYVELEFDVLYHNNPHPQRHLEEASELRVLRLLQVMLYPAVHNDEPLVTRNTDRMLKRAVLQLLGEVRSTYLVKDKLVCNIANKLLKKIHGNNTKKLPLSQINKNLTATSDYGSDDGGSDFENSIFSNPSFLRYNELYPEERKSTDCVEVVPTSNDGLAPVPTIELIDDDDDIYFVYLQKHVPTKRKLLDNEKKICRKKTVALTNENVNTQDVISTIQSVPTSSDLQNKTTQVSTDCVILSSDSEDEICDVPSKEVSNKKSKPKRNKDSKDTSNQKGGVVTFEILDDEDDDENNYMVYLQKEVATRKREVRKVEEIAICSDSDDDSSKTTDTSSQVQKCINELNPSPQNQVQVECVPESVRDLQNTVDKDSRVQIENPIDVRNCDEKVKTEIESIGEEIQASTSVEVFVPFNDELSPNQEACNPDLLIDPAIILQQITETRLVEDDEVSKKINNSTSSQGDDGVSTEMDAGDGVLGGPVMSVKADELEDLGNVSECRINESFLDGILPDDSYLLEGRKEFEELEYFLFNDSIEKQGFSLTNFSFDDNETVLQPETFHADIQSLESYLNDSHLIGVSHSRCNTPVGSSENSLSNNESVSNEQIKLNFTCRRLSPERPVKNTSHENWKKNKRRTKGKDLKSIFEQYKKVNRR